MPSSRPPLPVRRVAAAVEAGDDGERLVRPDDKHKRIGKAAQQGSANVPVDRRELPWISAHALDQGVHGLPEAAAQAGSLVLIPSLRLD